MRPVRQNPMERLTVKIDKPSELVTTSNDHFSYIEQRIYKLENRLRATEDELARLIRTREKQSFARDKEIEKKLDRLPKVDDACRSMLDLIKGRYVVEIFPP